VIFTTLGPRGWYQPPNCTDSRSRFEHFLDSPIPLNPLAELALRLHPRPIGRRPATHRSCIPRNGRSGDRLSCRRGPSLESLAGSFLEYWVRVRPTAIATPGTDWLARPVHRDSRDGDICRTRRIIRAKPCRRPRSRGRDRSCPRSEEAAISGVVAVYHPHSGPVSLSGNEAQNSISMMASRMDRNRQRVVTDLDSVHWEKRVCRRLFARVPLPNDNSSAIVGRRSVRPGGITGADRGRTVPRHG